MARKQAVLIMIQGPEPGSLHKLPDNRVTTIGRSSRNSVRVVNPSISRFHCEIGYVNRRWELRDLNSKKGTLVNGQRVLETWALEPGDIIRLATVVFRFDMVDETVKQDGAILSIMEAGMDRKLIKPGEATGSLEEIRARSRLEREHVHEELAEKRHSVKLNVAFLVAVAVLVAAVVAGVLAYAHGRAGAESPELAQREHEAQALYEEAVAALEAGDRTEAGEKLLAVQRGFPRSDAAAQAARARNELLWAEAQERLQRIPALEAEGDYAAALSAYEGLDQLEPEGLLAELIRQRRDYTERLALAAFEAVDKAARQKAEAGEVEAALALYRSARERIGVPELADRAARRLAELEAAPSP